SGSAPPHFKHAGRPLRYPELRLGFRAMSSSLRSSGGRKAASGFTLVEAMVSLGISSVVMSTIVLVSVYSSRAFSGMSNYVELSMKSRYALDVLSREFRQSTAVIACQTNAGLRYIALTNTESATGIKVAWDTNAATLTFEKTGEPAKTLLTGCDNWDVTF